MPSATLRQWHLLSLLPMGPRRVDSARLAAQLGERGLVVHRRTVQRDLTELAKEFPIVSDERTKPYGWRWSDDAGLLCAIPALRGEPHGMPELEALRRWLLRFAARVEVLEPTELRTELAEQLARLTAIYDPER